MTTLAFTDELLGHIDRTLAAVPPERGGALIAAGSIVHHFIEDTAARCTSVSWDISATLTDRVQAAEHEGRGKLRGTVHTHPSRVPDPSHQDILATARVLEENTHLDEILICIVTDGERRSSDLPIGKHHRMSVHVARRAPGGTCRVAPVQPRILPIACDLRNTEFNGSDGRSVKWEGITFLALDAGSEDAPRSLLVPDSYPLAGPIVVEINIDGEPSLAKWAPWNPSGDICHQLTAVLRGSGKRPLGLDDRIAPLVGRIASRRVLVVGLGSVGTAVMNELVRAGVEEFTVVDPEPVEGPNLTRTTYEAAQIGTAKCDAVAELAARINPAAQVTSIRASVADLDDALAELCAKADLVVAATDDPAGQALLSHHAYWAGHPLISCALYTGAAAGEVVISVPETNTPCWSCTIGGGIGGTAEKDYGTGRLVGELALGPPIHLVSLVAANAAISLLSGPDTPAGRPIAELLATERTLGIITTTPGWSFFSDVFADLVGHQWAPQSIWAKPQRDPACPICGDERMPPPADFGDEVNSMLKRLRSELNEDKNDGTTELEHSIPSTKKGGEMGNKHVNADKQKSQRARQSAARKAAQQNRGSNKFKGGSNSHNGGSRGQSGQPKR